MDIQFADISIETTSKGVCIFIDTSTGNHSAHSWPYADLMEQVDKFADTLKEQGYIVHIEDKR